MCQGIPHFQDQTTIIQLADTSSLNLGWSKIVLLSFPVSLLNNKKLSKF